MKTVIIYRDYTSDKVTLGKCYIKNEVEEVKYIGNSLERAWKDNENNESCIPEGEYDLVLEYSPRFKKNLWEIYGVPNRAECKFHAANYWYELNGCIALGINRIDINKDGVNDVTSSKATMAVFHKEMEPYTKAKLIVKNI